MNGDNLTVQQRVQNNYSKASQENTIEQYKKIRKTIQEQNNRFNTETKKQSHLQKHQK